MSSSALQWQLHSFSYLLKFEKVIAILLHGGKLVLQPIDGSIGFFKFLGCICQDVSNGPWPGFLERMFEAFGLGTQFPCIYPPSKVQHICSTWGAALVMTEGGEVVARKQLPGGSHLVGSEDVRHARHVGRCDGRPHGVVLVHGGGHVSTALGRMAV